MLSASSLTEISDSRALGLCPFFQLSRREGEGSRAAVCGLLGFPARGGVRYVESAPILSSFLPASRSTALLPSSGAPSELLNVSGLLSISLSMK